MRKFSIAPSVVSVFTERACGESDSRDISDIISDAFIQLIYKDVENAYVAEYSFILRFYFG